MSSFTLALASSQQILTDVRCKKYWQTFKWLIPSFKAATCLPEALLSRVCSLCRGRLVDMSWYYKKPLFPGNISPLKQAESLANFSLLNFSGSLPWAESWRFSSRKELYPDGSGHGHRPCAPRGTQCCLQDLRPGTGRHQTSSAFLVYIIYNLLLCFQQLHPLEFPLSWSRPGLRRAEKKSSSCSWRWRWAGRWRSRSVPV